MKVRRDFMNKPTPKVMRFIYGMVPKERLHEYDLWSRVKVQGVIQGRPTLWEVSFVVGLSLWPQKVRRGRRDLLYDPKDGDLYGFDRIYDPKRSLIGGPLFMCPLWLSIKKVTMVYAITDLCHDNESASDPESLILDLKVKHLTWLRQHYNVKAVTAFHTYRVWSCSFREFYLSMKVWSEEVPRVNFVKNLHVDPLSLHTFMRNKKVEFNPYIYTLTTLSKLYRFGYEIEQILLNVKIVL